MITTQRIIDIILALALTCVIFSIVRIYNRGMSVNPTPVNPTIIYDDDAGNRYTAANGGEGGYYIVIRATKLTNTVETIK